MSAGALPLQGASSQPWRVCRTNRIEASDHAGVYLPSGKRLSLYDNGTEFLRADTSGLSSLSGVMTLYSFAAIQANGSQSLRLNNSPNNGAPVVDLFTWLRMQSNSSGDLLLGSTAGVGKHTLYGSGARAMATNADGGMIEEYLRGSTTNATPAALGVFPLADPSAWAFAVSVLGVKSDYSKIVRYELDSAFRRVGGVSTQVTAGPLKTQLEDAAGCDVSMSCPGSDALLNVTGIAAETWRWSAHVRKWPMSSL